MNGITNLELDMCTIGVYRFTCVILNVIIVNIACKGMCPHMCCWPPLPIIYIEEGDNPSFIHS